MPSLAIDHLIVAGPDLDALVAHVAALTGLRAVAGGQHAGQGTRNALLGLGATRYLELLAPDPDQKGGSFLDGIAHLSAPALHTWCVRGGAADAVAERIASAGGAPRRVAMSRRRPDGVTLRWELVFVDGHAFGGLVPFFIDWLDSPHPSEALASGLTCEGLRLTHADEAGLRGFLDALGGAPPEVSIATGPAATLTATWRGAGGTTSTMGRG